MLYKCLDNFIDGREFLLLNADEVKAMIPPIGLAKKIIRLISKVTIVSACACLIVTLLLTE